MFIKVSQNSQANIWVGVSVLIKLLAWSLQLYYERDSDTGVSQWILRSFLKHPGYCSCLKKLSGQKRVFFRKFHTNHWTKFVEKEESILFWLSVKLRRGNLLRFSTGLCLHKLLKLAYWFKLVHPPRKIISVTWKSNELILLLSEPYLKPFEHQRWTVFLK